MTDGVITSLDFKRHMHRSTGFRSDIAVDLQALVGLELKDVVGGREERARSAPIGQTNQPGRSCRR
uniref:Chitinase-like protein n=1 Tax=Rhizobium meliloti TaxID=382 RepID=I2E1J4_RHIML|nr:chitinase-like protein [Sinorhizobium meliloti]